MNKHLTELVCILDASGSMAGMEADTIGGFNAMIERQKKEEGEAYVTVLLFANESETLCDRVRIHKMEPLTPAQYRVGGSTALMDTVGDAITHIDRIHKYAREEDRPAHTIFVITTDGMENASRRYTRAHVKCMIEEHRAAGWEFIFLAANIDAVTAAEDIGIPPEHAAGYFQSSRGTRDLYEAIDCAVSCKRQGKILAEEWKSKLKKE